MLKTKIIPGDGGEMLQFGPTRIHILEDGSGTENRISAISSTMAPQTKGPSPHIHLMHDECFLVTDGTLRFILGDEQRDANAGDYVVVPVNAPHTFVNASDKPVTFFTTFTSAFYIGSFRELAKIVAEGKWDKQTEAEVLQKYATVLI